LRPTSRLRAIYLAYLSKPSHDRLIYRTMLRLMPRRIVELGVGLGNRALRLIDIAARYAPRKDIEYIGIDPFEDRTATDLPGLSLIAAHRLLKSSGARIKLVPGNPWEALVRSATLLGPVDLLIFSAGDRLVEQMPQFWFYVPRLLHEKTAVFREIAAPEGEKTVQSIEHRDILEWAAAGTKRKAA
jgi:hypothetical protein